MAIELARAGADVLVHARLSEAAAQSVAAEIHRFGRRAQVVLYDLAEPSRQEALIEDAWRWGDGIDIWINNAGADLLTQEAANWSFERKLEQLLKVDLTASVRLARMIGEKMKRRGQGAILNVGWDQAEVGMAGDSGELFAAVKGGVMAFTRSLALSLAPEVRVNCVAPGWIKTAWGENASQYWQDRARQESAMGRWGTPEDVANVARFLVSPEAGFVTGQIVSVNGGWKSG